MKLVILQIRPSKSAEAYKQIWTDKGSPLLDISKKQIQGVKKVISLKSKPDHEEPLRFQIAEMVYNAVQQRRLAECDMEGSKAVLAQMMGVEQVLPMEDLMKHRETVAKNDSTHVDPVLSATQVVNIYSEEDFDEQFEALSAELAEE